MDTEGRREGAEMGISVDMLVYCRVVSRCCARPTFAFALALTHPLVQPPGIGVGQWLASQLLLHAQFRRNLR